MGKAPNTKLPACTSLRGAVPTRPIARVGRDGGHGAARICVCRKFEFGARDCWTSSPKTSRGVDGHSGFRETRRNWGSSTPKRRHNGAQDMFKSLHQVDRPSYWMWIAPIVILHGLLAIAAANGI